MEAELLVSVKACSPRYDCAKVFGFHLAVGSFWQRRFWGALHQTLVEPLIRSDRPLPVKIGARPAAGLRSQCSASLGLSKELNDCIRKLPIAIGEKHMLPIHHIKPLKSQRGCNHCLPGSQRLKHFDAHAAAETQRHDHQRGAVEIRRYIRHTPSHDNCCIRHLPYLGCRMISHDVQDRSWDARLHPWKDCARETQGCVDVGRMPKVSYEEQA